jgi:hypothetical protein
MRALHARIAAAARDILWSCWEPQAASSTARVTAGEADDAPAASGAPGGAPADGAWKRRAPVLALVVSTYLECQERPLEVLLELAQGALDEVGGAPGLAATTAVAGCPSLCGQTFSTWFRCVPALHATRLRFP